MKQGDLYVGWFDVISPDGTLAYRLGYKDVVGQNIFGLQITGSWY